MREKNLKVFTFTTKQTEQKFIEKYNFVEYSLILSIFISKYQQEIKTPAGLKSAAAKSDAGCSEITTVTVFTLYQGKKIYDC